MTIEDARFTAVLDAPLSAATASKRPVVLYVSNNIPLELIWACGCFPLQLPTAPRSDYSRADRYLEPNFEPMVRSALEQLLSGELNAARLLVLPRTLDAWQRLYYYLCELQRSFGEHVPEPFLYDLQQQPNSSSAQYNLESTRLLAAKLQALSGLQLTDAALRESIALYNRIRGELAQLAARRHQQPCKLSGADSLELITAVQRQDPSVAAAALHELNGTPSAATFAGTPTLLVGSAHDSPRLHQAIERAGGQVVSDFHYRGDWCFGPLVREDGDPLAALSEHYHQQSLSSRSYPLPLFALLDAAARSGAKAALFFYYNEEEALTWDYPAQSAALEARGLRTLLLPRQTYPIGSDVDAALQAFYAEGSRA